MKKKLNSIIIIVITISFIIINIKYVKLKDSKSSKKSLHDDISYSSKTQAVNNSQTNAKSNIILVNKTNTLNKNYIPKNLITPNVKFIHYIDPNVKQMDIKAGKALENLFNAASKDGITLLAVSGYRTYDYQERLYNNKGNLDNDQYLAKPGTSEHQTGLAMDVLSDEYSFLDEGFINTSAYKWLKNNCSLYGFIIRYPKEKENITNYNFEPWHIRYVGLPHSKEIMNNNLTLEEYLNN